MIQPLGDGGLLVRFATALSDGANRAALAFARHLQARPLDGVGEIHPNLVSVLLRYDPAVIGYERLAGEVRLLLAGDEQTEAAARKHRISVAFGGEDGPDLDEVAGLVGLTPGAFVAAHCAAPLRMLATGFAPGFVYCGFHAESLAVLRRTAVRPLVPAGTVLFAARQTAIAATAIPTGWHVIGRTTFRNFDAAAEPPTVLDPGDEVVFEPAT